MMAVTVTAAKCRSCRTLLPPCMLQSFHPGNSVSHSFPSWRKGDTGWSITIGRRWQSMINKYSIHMIYVDSRAWALNYYNCNDRCKCGDGHRILEPKAPAPPQITPGIWYGPIEEDVIYNVRWCRTSPNLKWHGLRVFFTWNTSLGNSYALL